MQIFSYLSGGCFFVAFLRATLAADTAGFTKVKNYLSQGRFFQEIAMGLIRPFEMVIIAARGFLLLPQWIKIEVFQLHLKF